MFVAAAAPIGAAAPEAADERPRVRATPPRSSPGGVTVGGWGAAAVPAAAVGGRLSPGRFRFGACDPTRHGRRFASRPPVKPCVRYLRTRLPDIVRRQACAFITCVALLR